jgi:CrcB protein
MERLFWICVAGGIGTGARHLISLWAAGRFGTTFPYGTLLVNLGGCFAIAVIMHSATVLLASATVRTALTVGLLGGLTTYSSFNYETIRLVQEGALDRAVLNLGVTVVGGLVAGFAGLLIARALVGH